jgi:hypothetical protein
MIWEYRKDADDLAQPFSVEEPMPHRRTTISLLGLLAVVGLTGCTSPPNAIGDDVDRDATVGFRECRKLLDNASDLLDHSPPLAVYGTLAIMATKEGYTIKDQKRHAKGGFVGVIFATDGAGSAEYNVVGADTSCVWVGRSETEHNGPPELTYQLRGLVVHPATGTNPGATSATFGVVRSIHTDPHTGAMARWTEDWSGSASLITHLELTTFNYKRTVDGDTLGTKAGHTSLLVSDSLLVASLGAQIAAPGPWFTCTPYGCCKLQK